MPLKRRRSPQEKKALSYSKDQRAINLGMGSDKAKRKARPAGKARRSRQVRKTANQGLRRLHDMSEVDAELVENSIAKGVGYRNGTHGWGEALADHIERQNGRREHRKGRKAWYQKNLAKARMEGDVAGVSYSWRGSEETSVFTAVNRDVLKRS